MNNALKRIHAHLVLAPRNRAERATALASLLDPFPMDIKRVLDAEAVIGLVKDDGLRSELADLLLERLDVHRAWMDDVPRPPDEKVSLTFCLPFSVGDDALLRDKAVIPLTEALDEWFAFRARDPQFPGHRHCLLAVPLYMLTAGDHWTLGFMLANAKHDTPLDQTYGAIWANYRARSRATNERVEFGYLFSLTIDRVALGAMRRDGLGPNAWAEDVMQLLRQHCETLNRSHPQLDLQFHTPAPLSRAKAQADQRRLRAVMEVIRQRLLHPEHVPRTHFEHVAEVMGLPPQEVANRVAELSSTAPDREQLAKAAVCRFVVCPDGTPYEFLQVSTFTDTGALTGSVNLQLGLGTPTAAINELLATLGKQTGTGAFSYHPTECFEDGRLIKQDLVRDLRGDWQDRGLLHWGAAAREIYRNSAWSHAMSEKDTGLPVDKVDGPARLPIPKLLLDEAHIEQAIAARFKPPFLEELKRLLKQPGMDRKEALQKMALRHDGLVAALAVAPDAAFPTSAMWAAAHFRAASGVLFLIDPTVQEQMALTDIEKKFPIELLRSPFPDIYIHLNRRLPVPTESGDEHWLDGAFVSERAFSAAECAEEGWPEGTRRVTVVMCLGSNEEPVDLRAPEWTMVIQPGDDLDLAQHMAKVMRGLVENEPDPARRERLGQIAVEGGLRPPLEICKILLYISLPDVRRTAELHRRTLLEKAQSASGKEKARLYERAARAEDVIRIGPIEPLTVEGEAHVDGEGRIVRPHLRRGFYRAQAHGPHNSLRKSVWIRPVLVNQRLLSPDDTLSAKDYRVR